MALAASLDLASPDNVTIVNIQAAASRRILTAVENVAVDFLVTTTYAYEHLVGEQIAVRFASALNSTVRSVLGTAAEGSLVVFGDHENRSMYEAWNITAEDVQAIRASCLEIVASPVSMPYTMYYTTQLDLVIVANSNSSNSSGAENKQKILEMMSDPAEIVRVLRVAGVPGSVDILAAQSADAITSDPLPEPPADPPLSVGVVIGAVSGSLLLVAILSYYSIKALRPTKVAPVEKYEVSAGLKSLRKIRTAAMLGRDFGATARAEQLQKAASAAKTVQEKNRVMLEFVAAGHMPALPMTPIHPQRQQLMALAREKRSLTTLPPLKTDSWVKTKSGPPRVSF